MSTLTAATLPPSDEPLPPEIAGRDQGWLTRYRRYPVFSVSWARGRCRVLAVVCGLLLASGAVPLLFGPPSGWPVGGLTQVAVQLFAPIYLGSWLGVLVRRRAGSEVREDRGLLVLMVALVAAMLLFHDIGSEPMKQWIAERMGQVDADGQRKRIKMAIGMVISGPDDEDTEMSCPVAPASAASAPKPAREQLSPMTRLTNGISSALLTFWLAGGAGLWVLRRERAGLAALARERELAQSQAQRREAELRLSVLAAQVEPHFLFNTLAGVRSAIATDPARASDMVDRLADYLRASIPRLRSSGESEATLGSQLEMVRAYLGLMAARLPRLSFHIDAPADLLAASCPPLMLISLAENAVKHGAEPKIGPVHIGVSARRGAAGTLQLSVEDDGAGFGASAAGSGLGLSNIRERLQQMYPGHATLSLKARAGGGVIATLELPLD